VLDTRFGGLARDNRWNDAGTPTFYVASDLGVAIAEFGRHIKDERGAARAPDRASYRLDVRVEALLDVRSAQARRALGLNGGATRFLDRSVARATANFIRRTTPAQALLVPSIAFLDDPSRWNLVLFLEKLPSDLSEWIAATYESAFRVTP
jgi:RES domain-containing protein